MKQLINTMLLLSSCFSDGFLILILVLLGLVGFAGILMIKRDSPLTIDSIRG